MGSGAAWCSAASPAATRRSGIREGRVMSETSIAVWDVPMPVVAGESSRSRSARIRESGSDDRGRATAAARWRRRARRHAAGPARRLVLDRASRCRRRRWAWREYAVRCGARRDVVQRRSQPPSRPAQLSSGDRAGFQGGARRRRNQARAVPRPHRQGGPRRIARLPRASIGFSSGAPRISRSPDGDRYHGDASIELTMVHVPEEHPDARWVR